MTAYVIITFKTKPEKQEAFRKILESVKINLPNAEGCKGVRVFNNTGTPDIFTLVETWDSEADHRKHIEHVIASGGWDLVLSHLAGEPETGYFTEL